MRFSSPIMIISLFLIISVWGCKRFDENKPEISSIRINNTSGNSLQANAGDENNMSVDLKDDKALSQILIKFSSATGLHDHSHDGAQHVFIDYNQGVWDSVSVSNISGKEFTSQFNFTIPEDVSGGWNLEVSALDESGNLVTEERTVSMINLNIPTISVSATSPEADEEGMIHLSIGQSINIEGLVLDPDSLASVKASIVKNSTEIWSDEITTFVDVFFSLSEFVEPAFTESGTYYYFIEASNLNGFSTKVRATIHVQ